MEKATPNKLAEPLLSSTQADVPHLFLNSTWMQTGERAIASTVKIDPQYFPTAHDQIKELGSDMPSSTAAHNAARFPYINAIGSMVTGAEKCDEKLGNTDKSEDKQGAPPQVNYSSTKNKNVAIWQMAVISIAVGRIPLVISCVLSRYVFSAPKILVASAQMNGYGHERTWFPRRYQFALAYWMTKLVMTLHNRAKRAGGSFILTFSDRSLLL